MNGRICELLTEIRQNKIAEGSARSNKTCAENELELYLRAECSAYDYIIKKIEQLSGESGCRFGFETHYAINELVQVKCELKKWLIKDLCLE